MGKDDRLNATESTEFGKAMSALLDNREKYETLRLEWEQKAKLAAEELEKASDYGNGAGEPEVVKRVRKILGV